MLKMTGDYSKQFISKLNFETDETAKIHGLKVTEDTEKISITHKSKCLLAKN